MVNLTQKTQKSQKYYLLCKYLVCATTRGIFPKENISALSALSARPLLLARRVYSTQKSQKVYLDGPKGKVKSQKYYLLCKYLVCAATRGIFPKENISALSALSARLKKTPREKSKEPRSQRRNTAPAEKTPSRTSDGPSLP